MADDGRVMTMKLNDTDPPFRAQIRDLLNPDGVDLTAAASVTLIIPALAISALLNVENQVTNKGWVNRAWTVGDVDLPGTHDFEVEIVWGTGARRTIPSHGYNLLVVTDDLG